jgi:hypothetical protein
MTRPYDISGYILPQVEFELIGYQEDFDPDCTLAKYRASPEDQKALREQWLVGTSFPKVLVEAMLRFLQQNIKITRSGSLCPVGLNLPGTGAFHECQH